MPLSETSEADAVAEVTEMHAAALHANLRTSLAAPPQVRNEGLKKVEENP